MSKDYLLLGGINGRKDRDSGEDVRMDKYQQNYLLRALREDVIENFTNISQTLGHIRIT